MKICPICLNTMTVEDMTSNESPTCDCSSGLAIDYADLKYKPNQWVQSHDILDQLDMLLLEEQDQTKTISKIKKICFHGLLNKHSNIN